MKLQGFRRIYKTDYPQDQQSLVDKLSVTINNGFESLYNAMSNSISLSDNISCTVQDITVTVDNTGKPTTSSSFQITTTGTIQGISVIRAINNTSSTVFPTAAPFLTYSQNSQLISISNIAGLPANNSFTLRCIAWA